MKKKLMLTLATLIAACLMCSVVLASASIVKNSPLGEGLLANGALNATNFMIQDDTDPSAYKVVNGNTTMDTNEKKNVIVSPLAKVPVSATTDGSKITLQFDVYNFAPAWCQQFYLAPFATHAEWTGSNVNYSISRLHDNGLNPVEGKILTSTITTAGGDKIENPAGGVVHPYGFQMDKLIEQKAAGRNYATFWFEFDPANLNYVVYAGNAEANIKTKCSTVTNAYTLPEVTDGYYFVFGFTNGDTPANVEFDNIKLYSTATNSTVTTYADFTFGDGKEVVNVWKNDSVDNSTKTDALLVTAGTLKTYDSLINVVNPGKNSRISSLNPLSVDASMTTTFDMSAGYVLNTLSASRKVGIAFGLDRYDTSLAAPANGASLLYFTTNENGDVLVGVDNIAEDGKATPAGTATAVTKSADNKYILDVKGNKDNSIDVVVNGADPIKFPGLKLSGNIAFAQTGEGDVNYSILTDSFALTAYSFKENGANEVVTASFDGNYISTAKFSAQSTLAPAEYIIAQNTTAHEIAGMVAEDGKIGFYGTSTNTRLMFNNEYSDFVLQFDYVSEPYAKRALPGGITTGVNPNRYSPFYILLGAESEIPEFSQTALAVGIVEGNATQYFWGAETLLDTYVNGTPAGVTVLSTVKSVEQSDEAIPCYGVAEGGVFAVSYYGMPNTEANYVYSFYNKITRVKVVAINNNIAIYAATVGQDNAAGEYVKIYETKVTDSTGYVGFGTDAPGWAAIDNVAITPIAKEKALELGMGAVPAVDLVADVAVASMQNDVEPTPLAKPQLTADAQAKKVTWQAVTGAKEYKVTVTLGEQEIFTRTVTDTQIDLSSLTQTGEYEVKVEAIPSDTVVNLSNRATVKYTLSNNADSGNTTGGDKDNVTKEDKGCKGSITSVCGLSVLLIAVAGVVLAVRKKTSKKD